MIRLEEIEEAVASLEDGEYGRFRNWFLKRDWERWDREIEEDTKAGKLDFLLREAAEAKQRNRLRDL